MTRYFFRYHDAGRSLADGHGSMLENLGAALAEARQSARELLWLDHGDADANFVHGRYEISDDSGAIVGEVLFSDVTA